MCTEEIGSHAMWTYLLLPAVLQWQRLNLELVHWLFNQSFTLHGARVMSHLCCESRFGLIPIPSASLRQVDKSSGEYIRSTHAKRD